MSLETLGDEIAGRLEAMNWFMLDLADELVSAGCIDKQRLLARLRTRDGQDDQLEYLRIARDRLQRLTVAFEAEGPGAARRLGGAV